MPHSRVTSDEIIRRGQLLYEQQIRGKVEAAHHGHYLVLDVETGEYEVDAREMSAWRRVKEKVPDGAFYILRVGFSAAYRIGKTSRKTA